MKKIETTNKAKKTYHIFCVFVCAHCNYSFCVECDENGLEELSKSFNDNKIGCDNIGGCKYGLLGDKLKYFFIKIPVEIKKLKLLPKKFRAVKLKYKKSSNEILWGN